MVIENYSYNQFNSQFPVSRETYEKLETYVALLEKWQKSINLISNTTLASVWNRHIVDSCQLVGLLSSSDVLMDLGCGAGLPGIILAIAGFPVTLVESDGKKVAFLREASRVLELDVSIKHQRVELVDVGGISTITARAFASLATILELIGDKLTSSHKLLLLKGKSYRDELKEIEAKYSFDVAIHPSITDPSGAILVLNTINKTGG